MSQTIIVTFSPGQTEAVAGTALEQWAYGQRLRFAGLNLPAAYQVDFSNFEFCGDSIPRIGGADGVDVPVEVLTSGLSVYAFVWIQTQDAGRRQYRAMIRVIPGPLPSPEEPNPEEESVIGGLIASLNDAVEAAESAEENAQASEAAAAGSAAEAAGSAVLAESWAVGDTGTREGEDQNNAKFWAEEAGNAATEAETAAAAAAESETGAGSAASVAAASATAAATAQTAAETAQGKAEDAQEAAEDAQAAAANSATNAATAASTASTKASEAAQSAESASGSAATATQQASDASASATAAAGSATNAGSSATAAAASATAAGNAQTAAETAQGKAEDAQEAAETAQSAAETAAASVSDSAAQIAQNTEDVADLKSAITSIRTDIDAPFVSFTPIDGKYIFNNAEKSGNAFSRSEPIAVSKGDIVEFTATGYSNSVAMIATSNAGGTAFTDAVRSTDSTEHTYTYTATADGYIVVSYDHRQPHSLVIKGEASNTSLNNRLTVFEESGVNYISRDIELTVAADNIPITIGQAGHFINSNGVDSASAAFNMSTVISLNTADYILFNSKGYLANVAILARVNDNSTYTPLIVSEDSEEHIFKYVALEPMNVVISTNKNVTPIYSIFNSRVDKNEARITALENDWVAFATMGVIGDSLASGASNYASGAADRPVYSWGKYIEREHGIAVSLFSFGGATTRTWFTDSRGQSALNNGDVLDCYAIGLGVNDAYSLGSSYLGSISDVHIGNESQNADTYYGNYSKIIATIKAKSPRAKIFCITNPKNTAGIADSFNDAIKAISALYTNVYVIDLVDDAFYLSKEFTDTWYSSHSTALGYKLISKNLYNHISNIIRNNIGEFTDIQWIAENHA